MPSIQEIRNKYPQYDDLSDKELSDAIYKKFYSDMPRAEFDAKTTERPEDNGAYPPRIGEPVAPQGSRSAIDVASKTFRDTVGERVGLEPDTLDAVHRYAGFLTPVADVVVGAGDVISGTSRAAAMGGSQALENVGVLDPGEGKRLGRGLVNLGEAASLFAAGSPAVPAVPRATTAAPTVNKSAEMVRAFERSNVTPSLAAVSDSRAVRSTATGLENIPVVGRPIAGRLDQNLQEVEQQAGRIASDLGRVSDDFSTGQMMRRALDRFANDRTQGRGMTADEIIRRPARETSAAARGGALYDKAGLSRDLPIPPQSTIEAIGPVVSKYSDDALSEVFKNTSMRKVSERVATGEPLTYADMKQLRRDVWKLQREDGLASSIDSADINRLYRSLTDDLEAVARENGKLQEFRRAEKFWQASQERISRQLDRFAGKNVTDEQAFARVVQATKEGGTGNIKSLAALRASLRDDEWGQVAATVFDRLGRTKGDEVFNPNNFITNYKKLSPQARRILTSHKPELRFALNDLTKVAEKLQEVDRARPRGSAPMQTTLGVFLAGANILQPSTMAATGGALLTSSMMASPRFVKWLTKAGRIERQAMEGKNVESRAQEHLRNLTLLAASNDNAAPDIARMIDTLSPDRRAVAEPEQEEQERPAQNQ